VDGPAQLVAPKVGGAPNVREVDGQLRIEWPAPRGESFVIRTSLFEAMINDLNAGKRLAAALERVKLTVDELS